MDMKSFEAADRDNRARIDAIRVDRRDASNTCGEAPGCVETVIGMMCACQTGAHSRRASAEAPPEDPDP